LRVDLPEHDRNWTTALHGLVAGSIGLKAMGIFVVRSSLRLFSAPDKYHGTSKKQNGVVGFGTRSKEE
jgi:hypothetical protein